MPRTEAATARTSHDIAFQPKHLLAEQRGSVSLWIAMALPLFLIAGGIALNVSKGMFARQGAQIAADLGAQAGAIAYGRDVDDQSAARAAADVVAMNGVPIGTPAWNAGSKTLTAGQATIVIGAGVTNVSRISVAVSVAKPVPMIFSGLLGGGLSRTVNASATAEAWNLPPPAASGNCVLSLHPTATTAIKLWNDGRINSPTCDVFANSTANGTGHGAAILADGGRLTAKSISTSGRFCRQNGATISPAMAGGATCVAPGAPAQADPFAGLALPTPEQPAGCAINSTFRYCCIPPIAGTVNGVAPTATNITNRDYTAWQSGPRTFSPANGGVFCGNTKIGGNGVADRFAPGIYYVVNGNLTFENSNVTLAQGVSFVMIGNPAVTGGIGAGNPGAINWTNGSSVYTMTAPTTGPTANILFWQGCRPDGNAPANMMSGGSTLSISGAFYARCGQLHMSNNVQLSAVAGGSFRTVASTYFITGAASINGAVAATVAPAASMALVR